MRTPEQWAYGATLDFYDRWLDARRAARYRERVERAARPGAVRLAGMLTFAAAMGARIYR